MPYHRAPIPLLIMAALFPLYSVVLLLTCILAAPFWIIKMRKRGGWGTGLLQRIGQYSKPDFTQLQGRDYYHAVSVGEVVIAIKAIKEIQSRQPDYRAVIACTTATGQEIARTQAPKNSTILYAPLDFQFLLRRLFTQLQPRQIILVDSELWPNLLRYTQRHDIPLKIINGRLSDKSYIQFIKFRSLLAPLLSQIKAVCVDGSEQASRWQSLGVPAENTHDVGSLKFDFAIDQNRAPAEFSKQLDQFPSHKTKILLASTHAPEEESLAQELLRLDFPFLLMVAPRHAERRTEVQKELTTLGYTVTSRTTFQQPTASGHHAFLLDTTGELSQWTSLADIVIIGKSWLKKTGGQNPFEAISQGKLLIAGPHMQNFEPLFSKVVSQEGAIQLVSPNNLANQIEELVKEQRAENIAQRGQSFLKKHLGATVQTADFILQN